MKLFAFKQQKHNPNKLANVSGEIMWLKEIIDESEQSTYEQNNWIVLISDDFNGYLLSLGIDPKQVFI